MCTERKRDPGLIDGADDWEDWPPAIPSTSDPVAGQQRRVDEPSSPAARDSQRFYQGIRQQAQMLQFCATR
jgi:hypothetical protein